jgi:hypothetical protein
MHYIYIYYMSIIYILVHAHTHTLQPCCCMGNPPMEETQILLQVLVLVYEALSY